jgi:hypothetical protein
MNATYLAAIAGHGAGLITHLGLVNEAGVELSGGGYARLPVTWTGTATKAPSANLLFTVGAGAQVAGWRGFSALTGGTNYGGAVLTTRNYTNAGTYELLAASTNINHTAP